MPKKDPAARRLYHREYIKRRYHEDPEYRRKHKEIVKANGKKYRDQIKDVVCEFKSSGCLLCDEAEVCCLDAHHAVGTKEFNIGQAHRNGFSPKRVRAELSKCVCVCSNCHRKIHAGILSI